MTKKVMFIYLIKLPNWKAPDPDGIYGFWPKNSLIYIR